MGFYFDSLTVLRMTGHYIEEMIDFILVIHRYLGVTSVTFHWVVMFIILLSLPLAFLPLGLDGELHLGVCVDRAVDHEHGSVTNQKYLSTNQNHYQPIRSMYLSTNQKQLSTNQKTALPVLAPVQLMSLTVQT